MSSYLVIAPQGFGDALKATPFIQALKEAQPSAQIDVAVTRRGPQELFQGLPEIVRDVMLLPYWDAGFAGFARQLLRSRKHREYDASFLMYPAGRREYQLLMRAFRAKRRFSHRYFEPALRNLMWLSTDLVSIKQAHHVLLNLDLLAAAGITYSVPTEYVVPRDWIAVRSPSQTPRVALHLGSIDHDGLSARRWPFEHFCAVARYFADRGASVTAIAGPAERAETLALTREVPQVSIFEGTIADVARMLSVQSIAITNDNGIGHLSAAVGTPVVALFGPTDPRGGPYGRAAINLRPSVCPPCFDPRFVKMRCLLDIDFRCLKVDLTVRHVIEAAERAIHAGVVHAPN